jgi:cell division protein FtsA
MTSLERGLTPKMRPMVSSRPTLVAGLDIGTSKIACLIGRLRPCAPRDALVGRSHAIDVIGFSHIQSRGVKAGAVVDANEAEQSVRQAVALAEQMAGVRVESVVLSVSAGRIQGQLMEATAETRGGTVTPNDLSRAMGTTARHVTGEGRTVLHALPVGYSLDGVKGIRDPRGMVTNQFGIEMNVVTADAAVARNLMLVVERCHLNVEAVVASPYVAGLAALADDESALGAAVIEMGAGTTTIAIYSSGRFVHASGFALGGNHITMDLARGLGACIADAERIKTLYGTVLTGGSDARELMTVPSAGDHDGDAPQIVSRGKIANIIRQRAEEIFEMVRDRLADSPFAADPRGRVVITGGASQLTGIPELASQILNRPARIGRPLGLSRLPNEAKGASFAVPAGLLVYPQFAHLEFTEPQRGRRAATGTDGGYFGKVGRWLREGF